MRKISIFFILLTIAMMAFAQEDSTESKKEKVPDMSKIKKAYIYVDEMLMLSEGELNCSYFITEPMLKDLYVSSSYDTDIDKAFYSDQDSVIINKGSKAGIKEGDTFQIIAEGKEMLNTLTGKNMGTYYLRKSLATVSAVYEDKSIIFLQKACFPVYIGDFVVPYKPGAPIFRLKPNFNKIMLPKSSVEGFVVYNAGYVDSRTKYPEIQRLYGGTPDMVTVDMGSDKLKRGDILVFYDVFRPEMPPLITGYGIVVNPETTNSTVKIVDNSAEIQVGTHAILLPETIGSGTGTGTGSGSGNETVPSIDRLRSDNELAKDGTNSMEVDIYFLFNEKNIDPSMADQFAKVKEFTVDKSMYSIIIRGYACSIGGIEYNMKLSQERVAAVQAYLEKELSIPPDRIESHFYGEKDAAFDNSSESERRKNRRVNIQVIGK